MPLWTPNPITRRVHWSITTRTQCVLNVADSQRNKSQLHKLSFVWPRNVSQHGPPDSGRELNAQDTANNTLVDLGGESQRNPLGNQGPTPAATYDLPGPTNLLQVTKSTRRA